MTEKVVREESQVWIRRALADCTGVVSAERIMRGYGQHLSIAEVDACLSALLIEGAAEKCEGGVRIVDARGLEATFGLPGIYVYANRTERYLWLAEPGTYEGDPSNAYDADEDSAPGSHPEFGAYDIIQLRRRYKANTVDGVPRG